RKAVNIPGTQHELEVVEYQENLSSFGQAAAIVLLSQNREPSGSWVLIDMPEFHGNRIQNYRIKVLDLEKTHFTGLQVKRDPGVWFVYIGFIVMLTGIAMTFYSSHRKLWVWASPEINGSHSTSVIIAGKANKNSLAFEQEFNQLCARLRDDLNPK
ncbi:MAG TPA: cytochrome c biogenesis protein ResB, partial [Syntrophobacteraceae bacterium]|nr:cytochrome c biogenesis protein ResB [Syntrophobacteraceae bacterium]